MGNILYWLIVGLVAGVIAKAIMPGTSKEPSGWIMTIVLGIVGALIGGFLATSVFGIAASNILMQIVIAVIGAIVLIAALRLVTGGRRAV
jgi:uncharacterized membrane protein YeaQ/YmgE (transglycosylase-associated protein family)